MSRAMALAEEPRPTIRFTTCTADADPLGVRRPDVARRTLRASYRRSRSVSPSSPTNALFKVSSNEYDSRSSPPPPPPPPSPMSAASSSPSIIRCAPPSSVVLALIMATLGVCANTADMSFPVSPYSVITSRTSSRSKLPPPPAADDDEDDDAPPPGEDVVVMPPAALAPSRSSSGTMGAVAEGGAPPPNPDSQSASLSFRNLRIRRLVTRERT